MYCTERAGGREVGGVIHLPTALGTREKYILSDKQKSFQFLVHSSQSLQYIHYVLPSSSSFFPYRCDD